MPLIRTGILAVLVFFFFSENRTILNDVAAFILGVEFATLFDLIAYYAMLIFAAYVVFIFSEHFSKEYYDGSKRYPKVSQCLSALLASYVFTFFVYSMLFDPRIHWSEYERVKNVALGLKIFVFVATFSSFGVLCAHRQKYFKYLRF